MVKAGYKQTEVGVIPEDWNTDYIQNLACITTGSKNTQDRIENGEYPFFVRSQIVERINSYSFDTEAILTAGDGVGTGKVHHYIHGKFDAHQRVYCILNFCDRLNGYFFYLYFSNHFYHRIMHMTAKSSVDSVRREMISKMIIPLPPTIKEQQAIAEALSDADALIESLEKLIAKKRLIKQGAMQELLTGKKRLAGFREKWKEAPVKDFGDIVTGGTPKTDVPEFWRGDIPWITPTDITDKKDIYSSERHISVLGVNSIRHLPSNSLLITCIASIGKNAILRHHGACNQQINAIIPKKDIAVDFLYYLFELQKEYLLANAGITATLIVSKKDFSELVYEIPDNDEQVAIAAILSDMDAEIDKLEQKLAKARQIKQGMMQELLTGRIRLI